MGGKRFAFNTSPRSYLFIGCATSTLHVTSTCQNSTDNSVFFLLLVTTHERRKVGVERRNNIIQQRQYFARQRARAAALGADVSVSDPSTNAQSGDGHRPDNNNLCHVADRTNGIFHFECHGRDLEALRPVVHNRNEIVLVQQQITKAASHVGPVIALRDEEASIEMLESRRNSLNTTTGTFSNLHEIQIFDADQNKTAEFRKKRSFDRALLTDAEEGVPIAPGRPVDNSYAEHSALSNALHLRRPAGLESARQHTAELRRLHEEQLAQTIEEATRCCIGRPSYPERRRTESFSERRSFCKSILAPKSSSLLRTGEEQVAREYKPASLPHFDENQHGDHELEVRSINSDSVDIGSSKDHMLSLPSVDFFGFSATVNKFEAAHLNILDDSAGRFATEPPALSNRIHSMYRTNHDAKGSRVTEYQSENKPFDNPDDLVDLEPVPIEKNNEMERRISSGAKLSSNRANQANQANDMLPEYDHLDTQQSMGLTTTPLNVRASPNRTRRYVPALGCEPSREIQSEIGVDTVDFVPRSLPALTSRYNPISVTFQHDTVTQQNIRSRRVSGKLSNSVGRRATLELYVPPINEITKHSIDLNNPGA
jgi:hypothetical protein